MGELGDVAELLACELVTNAYVHTDGPCSLRLRGREGGRLRVSVWDSGPEVPAAFGEAGESLPGTAGVEGGRRGLWLVRRWADRWGSYTFEPERYGSAGGKMLWFELVAPKRASPVGCEECAALEAVRRRVTGEGDEEYAIDAAIAVRRHFRSAHLLPEGAVW
nr:ATP-binding protein [Streptomyces sp. ISL-11]